MFFQAVRLLMLWRQAPGELYIVPDYRTAFISHAHLDNRRCDKIAQELRAVGVDLWIDLTNLEGRTTLPDEITRQLLRRQAFVLMVTPHSDVSAWVGNELDTYLSLTLDKDTQIVNGEERIIIPVVLEPTNKPTGEQLSHWGKVYAREWIVAIGKSDKQVADEIARRLRIDRGRLLNTPTDSRSGSDVPPVQTASPMPAPAIPVALPAGLQQVTPIDTQPRLSKSRPNPVRSTAPRSFLRSPKLWGGVAALVLIAIVVGIFGKSVLLELGSKHAIWKAHIGGMVNYASPTISNGVVYVGSSDDNLYAINATTGAQVWKFTTGGSVDSTPVVANGTVYVGSQDDYLYAINAATGNQMWRFPTNTIVTEPVVMDGVVYASGDNLYAINASTGIEEWTFSGNYPTTPAIANGTVYFGNGEGIYALNANTGTQEWMIARSDGGDADPVVSNGVGYIYAFSNLLAFNASAGTILWSFPCGVGLAWGTPVIANGIVYTSGANFYAINANTGTQEWMFSGKAETPVVDNGAVYVSTESAVYALNSTTGAQQWTFSPGILPGFLTVYGAPAVAGGVVYVGASDGNLYAINE